MDKITKLLQTQSEAIRLLDKIAGPWPSKPGEAPELEPLDVAQGQAAHIVQRLQKLLSGEDTWESLGRGFIAREPDQTYGACDL